MLAQEPQPALALGTHVLLHLWPQPGLKLQSDLQKLGRMGLKKAVESVADGACSSAKGLRGPTFPCSSPCLCRHFYEQFSFQTSAVRLRTDAAPCWGLSDPLLVNSWSGEGTPEAGARAGEQPFPRLLPAASKSRRAVDIGLQHLSEKSLFLYK